MRISDPMSEQMFPTDSIGVFFGPQQLVSLQYREPGVGEYPGTSRYPESPDPVVFPLTVTRMDRRH